MQPTPPLFEDALDGLAYVRDETLKQGKKAGMEAEALRKLEGLFSHAALQGFHNRTAPRN